MANIEQQSLSIWTWKTIFSLAAAGVIQVMAGVLLGALYIYIPFTDVECSCPLRVWLMVQGSMDIVLAISTGFTGEFSWTDCFISHIVYTTLVIIDYILWVRWRQFLLVYSY